MNAKIQVLKLSKTYVSETGETLKALDRVSVDVPAGQLLSIIGPSGCGKTTFLNVVAGLTPPTSGNVLVDSEEVKGPGPKIGVVFQQDATFMWRRVQENTEFGMEVQGVPLEERRKRAKEYLQLVGLSQFASFYPKELSGGMRKRLQLATVWANNPEILLMDEPFGALDYYTKVTLQGEVQKMWMREPKAILFVTHDVEEAIFLGDRILVFKGGRIVKDVSVPFERPRSDDLRSDHEFQSIKRSLWGDLG